MPAKKQLNPQHTEVLAFIIQFGIVHLEFPSVIAICRGLNLKLQTMRGLLAGLHDLGYIEISFATSASFVRPTRDLDGTPIRWKLSFDRMPPDDHT